MNARLASLAVAAVATAGLCVAAPSASASPTSATAGAAAASAAAVITYCPYRVNGTGVNVRPTPSTSGTPVGTVNSPQTGLASQNTYSGSGLTWRKGFGGYVAAQYLTRIAGNCAQ